MPNDQTLLLNLDGRLDVNTIADLKHTWQNEENAHNIIINLSETSFIDSMGLAALVSGLKTARQRGGHLYLVQPSKAVRTILELTAMDRAFVILDTTDDALKKVTA
jgi:anti-sigma B factor antagonist